MSDPDGHDLAGAYDALARTTDVVPPWVPPWWLIILMWLACIGGGSTATAFMLAYGPVSERTTWLAVAASYLAVGLLAAFWRRAAVAGAEADMLAAKALRILAAEAQRHQACHVIGTRPMQALSICPTFIEQTQELLGAPPAGPLPRPGG